MNVQAEYEQKSRKLKKDKEKGIRRAPPRACVTPAGCCTRQTVRDCADGESRVPLGGGAKCADCEGAGGLSQTKDPMRFLDC